MADLLRDAIIVTAFIIALQRMRLLAAAMRRCKADEHGNWLCVMMHADICFDILLMAAIVAFYMLSPVTTGISKQNYHLLFRPLFLIILVRFGGIRYGL